MSTRWTMLAWAAVLAWLAPSLGAQTNLMINGDFASGLSSWMPLGGPPDAFTHDAGSGYPAPGSARGRNEHPLGGNVSLAQCAPIVPGARYDLGAWCRLTPGSLAGGSCRVLLQWTDDAGCQTWSTSGLPALPRGSTTAWARSARRAVRAPLGAQGALVQLLVSKPEGAGFVEASFDVAFLRPSATGDLDNDGRADLLFANTASNRHVLWSMDGTVGVAGAFIVPDPAPGQVLAGVGDMDGDGKADLLFWDAAGGQLELWRMDGAARVGAPLALGQQPDPDQEPLALADLDGNGWADVIWQHRATRALWVWYLDGLTVSTAGPTSPSGPADANWVLAGAADANGDLWPDLTWYNLTSGRCVQWLMQGPTRVQGRFTDPPAVSDNNWRATVSADYGAGSGGQPGLNDLVWRNGTSGRLVVWKLDENGVRVEGGFTSPDRPGDGVSWSLVGPR